MLAGKTPHFRTAVFPARDRIRAGQTVAVRVQSATAHSLVGSIVDD